MNLLLYIGLPKSIQIKYRQRKKPLSEIDIIVAVTKTTGIDLNQMLTKTRVRPIVEPRQICMYFMYKHVPDITLKQIGSYFYRDHSTVMHSLDTVRDRKDTEPNYRALLDKIKTLL